METRKMLGLQFYKYLDDDTYDLKRIVAICNEDTIKVLDLNGNVKKINISELDDYTKIVPDGMISVVVADMGEINGKNVEDVIISLYKMGDMNLGNYEPYVVCRQNITDFFANHLATSGESTNLVGVSVSRDTCPENIDYGIMIACNDIKSDNVMVNIYIEDTIDSILGLIKSKPFDRTLEGCLQDHCKSKGILYMGQDEVDGYCKTLELLLKLNNFEFDLNAAYNILPINESISDVVKEIHDEILGDYVSLPQYIIDALSAQMKINIQDTFVVPYDRENFSLSDIADTKYLMLKDINNLLYIVNYTSVGEFRETDLEAIAARTAMEKIKSLFTLNTDKYEK